MGIFKGKAKSTTATEITDTSSELSLIQDADTASLDSISTFSKSSNVNDKKYYKSGTWYVPEDSFWSRKRGKNVSWWSVLNPCSCYRIYDYVILLCSFITWVTIIDVIVFIAELVICGVELRRFNILPADIGILNNLGARHTWYIQNGEIHRLIVPIFLHGGLFHLISNVAIQVYFGLPYERHWGILKMSLIYLIGGVAGNLTSAFFFPDVISVGSSGALFAMLGGKLANLVLRWRKLDAESKKYNKYSLLLLLACAIITSLTFKVDAGAHIGGVIVGFLLGLVVFANHLSKRIILNFFFALVPLIMIQCLFATFALLLYFRVPSPIAKYLQ